MSTDLTAKELVEAAWIRLRGKPATKAPQPGSAKFETYLAIARRLLRSWAEDPNYQWKSLRIDLVVDVINGQVELPDDYVRLVDATILLDGIEVALIDYAKRHTDHGVYEAPANTIGGNRRLVFTQKPENGAQLECSIIVYPPKLNEKDSVVICDSHDWIITALAAAIAMNDKSNQDAYPDLAGEAAQSYKNMAQSTKYRAEGQTYRTKRSRTRIRAGLR